MTPLSPLSYGQALARLDGLIDYERHPPLGPATRHFHLRAFRRFLDRLGAPDRRMRVIHIAGTRGKGSVATLLAEALAQRGLRVGMFRSPHVDSVRERITVDGHWITRGAFARQAATVLGALGGRSDAPGAAFRTHFECLVAIALLHFARRRVDWTVLETGLGGRLDATNVVAPELTILTALGLDHTRVLGTDLTQIAREKAGIIKRGVPCVLGPQPPGLPREALSAIRERADSLGVALLHARRRWPWEIRDHSLRGIRLALRGGDAAASIPRPGLSAGPAVATVFAALDALDVAPPARLTFTWPFAGRGEVVRRRPPWILDGAHDPMAIASLRATLDEVAPGPRRICLAVMEDKDHAGVIRALRLGSGDRLALPRITMPRAAAPQGLAEIARAECPGCEVETFPSLGRALRSLAGSRPRGVLVVTGSFYHLAPARRALKRLSGGCVIAT